MRSIYLTDQLFLRRRRRGRALHVSLDENNCLVIDNDPLITVSVSLDEDNCLIVEGTT